MFEREFRLRSFQDSPSTVVLQWQYTMKIFGIRFFRKWYTINHWDNSIERICPTRFFDIDVLNVEARNYDTIEKVREHILNYLAIAQRVYIKRKEERKPFKPRPIRILKSGK